MKQHLGLIGRNISYSFSKKYFENKFQKLFIQDIQYSIFDIQHISEVAGLFLKKNLIGFNVTIPYKVAIIPYLDELSEEAQRIGAVNTVLIKNGKKIGYNTDAFGFEKTLELYPSIPHHSALVLGDGGAAQAIKYVLGKKNIPYQTISRKGEVTFNDLDETVVKNSSLIVQCTPVGTFPDIEASVPFPFKALGEEHLVIDLIYNPKQTKFLKEATQRGCKTANGLFMLEQQAEKAWKIWSLV